MGEGALESSVHPNIQPSGPYRSCDNSTSLSPRSQTSPRQRVAGSVCSRTVLPHCATLGSLASIMRNLSSVDALKPADWTHRFQRMERLHASLAMPSIATDGVAGAESIVIGAFLTRIRNVHQGAFAWHTSRKNTACSLRRAVEDLILNSPGLCATLGRPNGSRLIVLHDQEPSSLTRWRLRPGVELRHVALKDSDATVSNDRRWLLFEQALRADTRWECAYAIDLTDVRVLALPPCATLPAEALVLASDDTHHCCRHGGKRWLEDKARPNPNHHPHPHPNPNPNPHHSPFTLTLA